MSGRGWIGVDLDGTLARYESGQGGAFVGEPVTPMVERVRTWLAEGQDVRIFTARVSEDASPEDRGRQVELIEDWCQEQFGQILTITYKKDFSMVELWDDRAVHVEKNTGRTTFDRMGAIVVAARAFILAEAKVCDMTTWDPATAGEYDRTLQALREACRS